MNLCIDFKPFAEWVSRSCPSASSCHLQATSCSTSLIFASKSTWYLGCKSFIDKINFLVTDTLNTHPPPTLLISSFPIRRAVIHFSPRKLPYTERMLSLIELPLSVCLSVCLSLSLQTYFHGLGAADAFLNTIVAGTGICHLLLWFFQFFHNTHQCNCNFHLGRCFDSTLFKCIKPVCRSLGVF